MGSGLLASLGTGITVAGVPYYVYLLASRRYGTLYLGVTNDLSRRVWEHKSKVIPGFSKKYGVDRLVWYEVYERIDEAIAREKDIKKWRRDWKIRLIEEMNPDWMDLYALLNR
jgi:putative endonuclease